MAGSVKNIDIDNWELIAENNETTYTLLDRCCSDVSDLMANVDYIKAVAPTINDELAKLKTTDTFKVWEGIGLKNKFTKLSERMADKAGMIVTITKFAERMINNYNSVTSDEFALLDDMISNTNSGLALAEDLAVYWVIKAATDELGDKGFGALSFIGAYGADARYNAADFQFRYGQSGHVDISSSAAGKSLFKMLGRATRDFESQRIFTPRLWCNVAIGTGAVALFSLVKNSLQHEGEWSSLDTKELWTNVAVDSATYVSWAIAFKAATVAGATGLWPGVIAAVVAIPTSMLFKAIGNRITGNYKIDTFTRDGKEYIIYENGFGHNGEYDDLLRTYSETLPTHYINGEAYSETTYKNMMYEDWYSVVSPSIEYIFPPGGTGGVYLVLEALKDANSVYEAEQILQNRFGIVHYYDSVNDCEFYSQGPYGTEQNFNSFTTTEDLNNMQQYLGFSLEEYIDYWCSRR